MKFLSRPLRQVVAAVFAGALLAGVAAGEGYPKSGVIATNTQHAQTFFEQQKWRELELFADRWRQSEPYNWEAFYYWGLALLRQGKPKEGAAALTTAQTLSPRVNDRLWLVIAEAHEAAGDLPTAETTYRTLLQKYADRSEIWLRLLGVLEKQEEPKKRREESDALAQLLAFAPYINDINYWQRQVNLLLGLEDADAVRAAQSHILRLDAGNLPAAEWIFRYEIDRGDKKKIDEIVKRLLLIDKESPLARMYLGDQAFAAKRLNVAKWHYEALQDKADYPRVMATALTRLAQIDSDRNHFATYWQAINADPSYLPAWEGAVVALQARGASDKAAAYLQRLGVIKRRLAKGGDIPRNLLDGLPDGNAQER